MDISLGLTGRAASYVDKEDTAREVGSGALLVYATPCMIAMMEAAAAESLLPYLEQGQTSVGVSVQITHESATPVGMEVWAESKVTAVEGKKVSFSVCAYDERGLIGSGMHTRVIVTTERFLEKTYSKI